MPKRELLIATTNRKKLEELKALLASLKLRLLGLRDFPQIREIPEDGDTFAANARRKASGYSRQTGCLTLAEDSGLCCDALEGAPGVFSARFSGPLKSDRENNLKVLRLLDKVPDNCRGAHFRCAVALAGPRRLIGVTEGEVHGVISREIKGSHGFGYDPIFYYPPFGKCFGEISAAMKHQVSHRSQALQKARGMLEKYWLKALDSSDSGG